MNRTEMISYVEKKGYKVNYGNYCFNSCVPYFVVNDITIFIAKNNGHGLVADADYSKARFEALEYFCKSYYPHLPGQFDNGEESSFDFSNYYYDFIRRVNNTVYPWFPLEDDFCSDFDFDFDDMSDSDLRDFFTLRRKIFSENNLLYKKLLEVR